MKRSIFRALVALVLLAYGALPAQAQPTPSSGDDVVGVPFVHASKGATIGGDTFGEVLRVVGMRDVSSGPGTVHPTLIDSSGNTWQDNNTATDTTGRWFFGKELYSPFVVSVGTSADAALGFKNVRITTNGSARLTIEDTGYPQWTIDNLGGFYRLFRTNSSGTAVDGVQETWGDNLVLNPKGGTILPTTPYGFSIGSPFFPINAFYVGNLFSNTITAQETIATVDGEIIVAPTATLVERISSTATTIKIDHNNLSNGSTVYLKRDFRFESIGITSAATPINKCTINCNADSTTNWSQNGGGLTLDRNVVYQGDASILWTPTSGTARSIWHVTAGNTANSTQYTISFYLRRSDAAAIVPNATDYLVICGDGGVTAQMTATDATNGWYRLSSTCTTSGATSGLVGVTGLPSGVNFNIDALQIETGSTLTPWLEFSSSYTVTRNQDGGGGNAWEVGTPLVDTSTFYLDIYSNHSIRSTSEVGPTIVGFRRLSTTWNDTTPRWACGNLNGLYGYGVFTSGCAFGNFATTWVDITSTNGFRVMSGSSTVLTQWDASGNGSLTGSLAIGTSGNIRSGATAFGTGTGFWLAYNGGTPQARIGNPSGRRVQWDGTDLGVYGAGYSLDASGMVWGLSTTAHGDTPKMIQWTGGGNTDGQIYAETGVMRAEGRGGIAGVDWGTSTLDLRAGLFDSNQTRMRINNVGDIVLSIIGGAGAAALRPSAANTWDLGTSSVKWRDIYFSEPTTTSALFPLVSNSGRIMAKNNGLNTSITINGNCIITFEYGVAVAHVGAGCP